MTARGLPKTGSILDGLVADKANVVAAQKQRESEPALRARFGNLDPGWPLRAAVARPRGRVPVDAPVQIVAEIKKASPSKGVMAAELDYLEVARQYTLAGA